MPTQEIVFFHSGRKRKSLWSAIYGRPVDVFPHERLPRKYIAEILEHTGNGLKMCASGLTSQTVSSKYINAVLTKDDIVVLDIMKDGVFGEIVTGFASLKFNIATFPWKVTMSVICSTTPGGRLINAILLYLRNLAIINGVPINHVDLNSLWHAIPYYKRFGFKESDKHKPRAVVGNSNNKNENNKTKRRIVELHKELFSKNHIEHMTTKNWKASDLKNWHPENMSTTGTAAPKRMYENTASSSKRQRTA